MFENDHNKMCVWEGIFLQQITQKLKANCDIQHFLY